MIGPRRIVLEPREVPLGDVRDMNVLRTLPHRNLPHRNLPTIGAGASSTGSVRPRRACAWSRTPIPGCRR